MNEKTKKIVGWVLAGLLAAMLIFSAIGKLTGQMNEAMVDAWGFSSGEVTLIAVGELLCVVLFLIPKTFSLGTLMLSAYMGGAIATHMQAAPPMDSYLVPSIILVLVWVIAAIRSPDMFSSFKS